VLTTGIDLDVRCIVLARPTKSRILFTQTIGRGLRTAEGKDYLLILDHAGNHLRLGMVTDIAQDRLDDGKD
jgi:DNA repair protein RadD